MKKRRNEAGIGFLSLAITMPVLLVSVALAVDVARVTHARNDLQNALDAAALAGARAIYDTETSVENVLKNARNVAGLNELQGTQSTINIDISAIEIGIYDFPTATFVNAPQPIDMAQVNSVRVQASMSEAASPIALVLAGVESYNPTLSAVAVLGAPSKSKSVFPMVVVKELFADIPPGIPTAVPLSISPGSVQGAWTAFTENPDAMTVTSIINEYVLNPFSTPEINSADIVTATNGTMNSAYMAAFELLPPGTSFTVLVVDKTSGWNFVTVVGFASFKVLEISDEGGDKIIHGELVKHDTQYTGETTSKCFGMECRPFLVD